MTCLQRSQTSVYHGVPKQNGGPPGGPAKKDQCHAERHSLLPPFFVHRLSPIPLAKLLELYFALNFFAVFAGPVVDALARLTLEFYEVIL